MVCNPTNVWIDFLQARLINSMLELRKKKNSLFQHNINLKVQTALFSKKNRQH